MRIWLSYGSSLNTKCVRSKRKGDIVNNRFADRTASSRQHSKRPIRMRSRQDGAHFRERDVDAQQIVHGSRLDHEPFFPIGDRLFGDAELVGECAAREAEALLRRCTWRSARLRAGGSDGAAPETAGISSWVGRLLHEPAAQIKPSGC